MSLDLSRKQSYREEVNQDYFVVRNLRMAVASQIDEWSRGSGDKSVIDVGCGGQPFRKDFESRGFTYCAADRGPSHGVTPDVIFTLGETLPANFPRYRFVFCTEVLEHVPNWDLAFENLAGLAEKGGEIFLTTPFVYPRHEEPYDFFRGSPAIFATLAAKHGLEVISQRQQGGFDDVLGTITGHALLTFQYGASAYTPAGILQRIRQRFLLWLLKAVRRQCQKGNYAFALGHTNSLYLSNIVRLRKP